MRVSGPEFLVTWDYGKGSEPRTETLRYGSTATFSLSSLAESLRDVVETQAEVADIYLESVNEGKIKLHVTRHRMAGGDMIELIDGNGRVWLRVE